MKTANEEILKEFENDLALYKKNLETAKAILTLRKYKSFYCKRYSINEKDDDVIYYLTNMIVSGLEDPNVKIRYKGKIKDINHVVIPLHDKIKSKYSGLIDDKILSSKLDKDQIESWSITEERAYNVATYIAKTNSAFRILDSDISIDERKNIFIDMAKEYGYVIDLLFNRFTETDNTKKLCSSMEKPSFLRKILKEFGIRYIARMMHNGINGEYYKIIGSIIKDEDASLHISLLKEIYNSKEYQEKTDKSQKEVDLKNIIGVLPIGDDFIKEANTVFELDFDVEEYVFDAFAKKIVSSWDRLYNPDIVRKEIADKLLAKAKDEEDKERLIELYNKFLEDTDVKKHRQELKQEKRRRKLVMNATKEVLQGFVNNLTLEEKEKIKQL